MPDGHMEDTVWRRALLTSSLDAVILMDGRGDIVDFNQAAEQLFHLSRSSSIGASLGDLIVPPEFRAAHRDGLARFIATGVSHIIGQRIEIDAVRTDGRRLRVELTIAVLDERRELFISHIRDIQARVQAERRLRATAAVSHALADAMSAGEAVRGALRGLGEGLGWLAVQYWRVDAVTQSLVLANSWIRDDAEVAVAVLKDHVRFHRGEGLPGITWEAGEAQWLENVVEQRWLPRFSALASAGVATGLAFPVRIRGEIVAIVEGFSDEYWPREPELLAVLQALGAQLGHVLDERTARLETELARQQAEAANRLKDEFLSVASHELRTPLNAVLGWVHLLREGRLEGDAARRAVDAIARNASVQVRLVNDLLDMSRIIAGKFQLEVAPFDLREAIGAAIDVVRPSAEAKNLTLVVHEPRGVPVAIRGDAGRLQQVFWNVLSNAVKFTPRDGRIEVTTSFAPGTVTVAVEDSGIGMDPAFVPRMFDRFAQADQTSGRLHGGLGLGLSIAQQFVQLHGGTIEAHSEGPGRGATVSVTIPVTASAEEPRDREGTLAGLRLLVVSDEAPLRTDVARVLERAGGRVDAAASAEEALGCLSQSGYEVVVCDVDMPGRDGIWLARELASHPPARSAGVWRVALVPPAAEQRQRARDAGFDAIVDTPISPPALIDAVQRRD